MRKLHPSGPHERLLSQGSATTPEGDEAWTVHDGPAGRRVLRVDAPSGLWHAVLDEQGSPERVQVRLGAGAAAIDATFTFFADEVLVWRRGAEPASEVVPVPGPCALEWPLTACREQLEELVTRESTAVFGLRVVPGAEGGVVGAVVDSGLGRDEGREA